MAVAKDGKIVIERGYGVRQAGQPDAVDTHTLFAIGSTTKAMTAALVGRLVDDKRLAWDDPVVKHLPCKRQGPFKQQWRPLLTAIVSRPTMLTQGPR